MLGFDQSSECRNWSARISNTRRLSACSNQWPSSAAASTHTGTPAARALTGVDISTRHPPTSGRRTSFRTHLGQPGNDRNRETSTRRRMVGIIPVHMRPVGGHRFGRISDRPKMTSRSRNINPGLDHRPTDRSRMHGDARRRCSRSRWCGVSFCPRRSLRPALPPQRDPRRVLAGQPPRPGSPAAETEPLTTQAIVIGRGPRA